MNADFLGKKLIVMGGTSGIGKAVASLVLRNGGRAVIVGRQGAKIREATIELGSYGEVSGLKTDSRLNCRAGRQAYGCHLIGERRGCFPTQTVSRTHRG